MLSALILGIAALTSASAPMQDGGVTPGALRIVGEDGKASILCPLKGTSVSAKIEGFGARVIVVQTFTNPTNKPIEAIYTFPLPQDSAVDGMRMVIGSRIIEGVIMRRAQARETYEQAKKEGKSAALLDQERPNMFTQSVANIPPGAEIRVALTYVQILKFENDEFEFVYPMVVAPRFAGETTPDPSKISPPIVPEGTRSGSTIDLKVEIDAGARITSMSSVLHKIDTQRVDDRRANVKLLKTDEIPNRDFILRYGIATNEVTSAFLTHVNGDKGGFFTLIIMPPKAPTVEQVAPKEVILVMDQSGSQRGRPIEKSKELSYEILNNLNQGDTLNIVSFSNTYTILWNRAKPNTAENRAEARKFISNLEANGGTQLEQAVNAALTLPPDPRRPRVVTFNTDGLIGGEAEALRQIQKHRGNARMFTFGIGNSVNRYLIEAMSTEGRGDHEIVTLQSDVDAAVRRLVQRTDSPVLTDVKVEFEDVDVNDVLPRHVPDLFSEKPLIVKGRYSAPGEGHVTVSGNLGGKPWSRRYPIRFPSEGNSGSAIGSLWAREKVNDLELQQRLETTWSISQGKKETNWDELITELALEFGIMTRFTSFVAVDRQVVNPGGKQDTIRVPVDMADGIEYEGIFGSAKPGRLAGGMPAPAVPAFRPGDPLLSVTAPASATVVAVFPDGDIKPLTWNPAVEKWEVRFDIPNSFREGVYHVKVHIRNVDGTRRSLTVPFEVTENTPELKPSSVLVGSSVRIEVPADPRWDRILLLTPNGEKLEFKYDAASGMFRVEGQFGPGWYQIVGADRAFGQRTIRILLGKEGRIEKIEPAH